jgi:ABC-type sugar transport system ATPase subunit
MNMIPAEIAADAQCIVAAGASLPMAAGHGIAHAAGMKATFGIRPEDIALLPPGTQAPAVVEAQVTMVEPLGAEFLLSFALNGHEITAKIAGRALPGVGERLRFAFDAPCPRLRRHHGAVVAALTRIARWTQGLATTRVRGRRRLARRALPRFA